MLRRPLAPVALVAVVVALFTPVLPAAAGSEKDLPLGEACDIVTDRTLEKLFGGEFKLVLFDPLGLFDCVRKRGDGPTTPGGGQFHFIQLYPGLPLNFPTPRETLEDQRAVDVLGNAEVVDIDDLGDLAYVNRTDGSLAVVANDDYAFKLTWLDDDPAAGLTKADQKRLVKLARKLVKRASK